MAKIKIDKVESYFSIKGYVEITKKQGVIKISKSTRNTCKPWAKTQEQLLKVPVQENTTTRVSGFKIDRTKFDHKQSERT